MPEIDIPARPTTAELYDRYPLDPQAEARIADKRLAISSGLGNYTTHLFGIVGYCARPNIAQQDIIHEESAEIADLENLGPGMVAVHRGPTHKPRTNPEKDYQGEEQTDPEGAYKSVRDEAEQFANVAIEVRCSEHVRRYGHLLSYIWTGGRNVYDDELMRYLALHDPSLPVGNKNGLDGDFLAALQQSDFINELRSDYADPAPAVPIYRGGKNATNPKAWRDHYLEALDLAEGEMIVDVAHGSEMAHHPEGEFKKSAAGQILAMETVLNLAQESYVPAGIMIEASDLESRTDPHMPLSIALDGVHQLYIIKSGKVKTKAKQQLVKV